MSRVSQSLLAVPVVVDEVTVRLLAAVVFAASLTAVLTQQWWWYAVLAADFALRAVGGPRLSPIARAVQAWLRPRLTAAPHPTAFAPKRFASGIGAVMTTAAVLLSLTAPTAVSIIGVLMVVFSGLEAGFAFCVGCRIFALLARAGVVREQVCVDCVQPSSAAADLQFAGIEDSQHARRAG